MAADPGDSPPDSLEPAPAEPTPDLTGQVIAGRYKVLKRLAEGGMSRVFQAEQLDLKRVVAVKVLKRPADLRGEAEKIDWTKRFEREAAVLATLSHPNIVVIHEFGVTDDGLAYLAMEYIEGETLSSHVRTHGPLDGPAAVRVASQIASALEDAHTSGSIHRDLKPQNIMLVRGKTTRVKVLDFGIVKSRAADDDGEKTQEGIRVGSPRYMAPEQVSGDPVSPVGHWLVDTLGVPVVLGPSSSGDAESMYAEIIEPAEPAAILMSTAASSPSLTPLEGPATDENPGYLWRTAASAADQSVTVATDMRTRTPEIRNVAIVREMGAFGSGLAAPFVTAWTATGGTYEEFIYADGNATARSEQITRLGTRTAEFDAVYFIGQAADSRAFMAQVTDNAAYTTDLYYYFPQGGGNNDVFADASSSRLFTRVRAARPSVEATFEYQAFRDAYVARFDGLDPGTISNCPHGFDAMWVSALGAAWAASHETITGRSVARGIRQTFGGTVTASFVGSDWARSVTALQAGMRLDVTGASGPLDFDPVTEETMGAVELVEGQMSGTFVVLD